jgi:hypothetical protein
MLAAPAVVEGLTLVSKDRKMREMGVGLVSGGRTGGDACANLPIPPLAKSNT